MGVRANDNLTWLRPLATELSVHDRIVRPIVVFNTQFSCRRLHEVYPLLCFWPMVDAWIDCVVCSNPNPILTKHTWTIELRKGLLHCLPCRFTCKTYEKRTEQDQRNVDVLAIIQDALRTTTLLGLISSMELRPAAFAAMIFSMRLSGRCWFADWTAAMLQDNRPNQATCPHPRGKSSSYSHTLRQVGKIAAIAIRHQRLDWNVSTGSGQVSRQLKAVLIMVVLMRVRSGGSTD